MFVGDGKSTSTKKKEQSNSSIALDALIQAILHAFSSDVSPRAASNQPLSTRPAKEIESQSKCYKQLSEPNQLRSSGIRGEVFGGKRVSYACATKLKRQGQHKAIFHTITRLMYDDDIAL